MIGRLRSCLLTRQISMTKLKNYTFLGMYAGIPDFSGVRVKASSGADSRQTAIFRHGQQLASRYAPNWPKRVREPASDRFNGRKSHSSSGPTEFSGIPAYIPIHQGGAE